MTTDRERALDARLLGEILENGPRDGLPEARGGICQTCGRTGYVRNRDEDDAANAEGGYFLAFSAGHGICDLGSYDVAHRPWRFCEGCRRPTPATAANRVGLTWLCVGCRWRIDRAGHDPAAVLADLGLRRWAARARFPDPPELELDDLPGEERGERIPPPPGWLPRGLHVCGRCGEIAGTAKRLSEDGEVVDAKSTCFCEGLVCRSCGHRRIHRPISNHFDPRSGRWLHVAYFRAFDPRCHDCRAEGRSARDLGGER